MATCMDIRRIREEALPLCGPLGVVRVYKDVQLEAVFCRETPGPIV